MTNLMQVTGSSLGDDSAEQNIRSQSYFYPGDERKERQGRRHDGGSVQGDGYLHAMWNAIMRDSVITANATKISAIWQVWQRGSYTKSKFEMEAIGTFLTAVMKKKEI